MSRVEVVGLWLACVRCWTWLAGLRDFQGLGLVEAFTKEAWPETSPTPRVLLSGAGMLSSILSHSQRTEGDCQASTGQHSPPGARTFGRIGRTPLPTPHRPAVGLWTGCHLSEFIFLLYKIE